MRVRLAFVVVCVLIAGGTAFGARGESATVAFLRATGQTVCNSDDTRWVRLRRRHGVTAVGRASPQEAGHGTSSVLRRD